MRRKGDRSCFLYSCNFTFLYLIIYLKEKGSDPRQTIPVVRMIDVEIEHNVSIFCFYFL